MAAGGASAGPSRPLAGITVFAGSSMTAVLPQLDPNNTYSFASTGTLAAQIANGAPADVLMGANTATVAALYAQGVVEKPVDFTRNRLEIVVPKSNPAGIKSIYDLIKPGVKVDEAAPTVPVGSYTVQVLSQMGLARPSRRTSSARRPTMRTSSRRSRSARSTRGSSTSPTTSSTRRT